MSSKIVNTVLNHWNNKDYDHLRPVIQNLFTHDYIYFRTERNAEKFRIGNGREYVCKKCGCVLLINKFGRNGVVGFNWSKTNEKITCEEMVMNKVLR